MGANLGAKATQPRLPNGNTAAGFGYINATTTNIGAVAPVTLSPRYRTVVGRFTFSRYLRSARYGRDTVTEPVAPMLTGIGAKEYEHEI
jgi:hypothetical protein